MSEITGAVRTPADAAGGGEDEELARLLAAMPELPGLGRTVVGLRPRRGEPGVGDSHVGGPMLWPAGEPWPFCADREHEGHPMPPMVSVAQLYAADLPEIAFPQGTDLVQILWCPQVHSLPGPASQGKNVLVFWRSSGEVVHQPGIQPDPWEHYDAGHDEVPQPCTVHPERIHGEYPWWQELPAALRQRLEDSEELLDLYWTFSLTGGWKIGGSKSWSSSDMPDHVDCVECGAPYTLLLQVDSYEDLPLVSENPHTYLDTVTGRHVVWRTPECDLVRGPTGFLVDDVAVAGVYVCSAGPRHRPMYFGQ